MTQRRRQAFMAAVLVALFSIQLTWFAGAQEPGAHSANSPDRPKFILLTIDRVSWQDLTAANAPTLQRISREGAIGLMVARSAAAYNRDGYLTIGAGARLRTSDEPSYLSGDPEGFAFDASEVAGLRETYTWLTGNEVGSAAVAQLALASIQRDSEGLDYPAAPGQLGEALRQNGIVAAGLGNADLPGRPFRPIAAIAMDAKGLVPLGNVGQSLLEQNSYGFPQTSLPALLAAFDEVLPRADFIAIDFGDTGRLARSYQVMSDAVLARHRLEAIQRADLFLAELLTRMKGRNWRLLIISPDLPQQKGNGGERLAPALLFGPQVTSGWLTSPSTRARGIIVNTDIAPTVLNFFGVNPPAQMVGRPISIIAAKRESPAVWLTAERARRTKVDAQRSVLVKPAQGVVIAVLALAAIALLLERHLSGRLKKGLRYLCLGLLSWPVMILLFGLALPPSPALSWLVTVAGCVILTAAALLLSRGASALALLSAPAAVLLAGSLLCPEQTLLRYTPLSYSAADGARYYGIGNELGGVFLGAVLFGAMGLWQSTSAAGRGLRWPLMGAIILLLGLGRLGANFGMTLAAVVAFWVVGLMLLPARSVMRRLWLLALVAAVAVLIGADLLSHAGSSHIGQAAQQMQHPAQTQLLGIVARKLEMNLKLLQNSLWAYVLAAALGLIIIAALKLDDRFSALLRAQAGMRVAFLAALAGGIAAFVFNDSGTLAAALCLLYPAASIGYLALADKAEVSVQLEGNRTLAPAPRGSY